MTEKQTAGQRMIASAKQALTFSQGENDDCVVHIPNEIDTARIREKINMSQSQFAAYFGVSVRTVQEWEQGRAVPSGPARAFLTVIDHEPEAVRRALMKQNAS
jgi:putative transcriptional regulator